LHESAIDEQTGGKSVAITVTALLITKQKLVCLSTLTSNDDEVHKFPAFTPLEVQRYERCKNKHSMVAGKFKTTGPSGSPRRSLEDNIKADLKSLRHVIRANEIRL
jgi:hypothetical protein